MTMKYVLIEIVILPDLRDLTTMAAEAKNSPHFVLEVGIS